MGKFSYRLVKGKYVITKGDGAYFTLERGQIDTMLELLNDIKWFVGEYEQKDNRGKHE